MSAWSMHRGYSQVLRLASLVTFHSSLLASKCRAPGHDEESRSGEEDCGARGVLDAKVWGGECGIQDAKVWGVESFMHKCELEMGRQGGRGCFDDA